MNSKKDYILLIYNPMSGSREFPALIDYFIEVFQKEADDVVVHRISNEVPLSDYLKKKSLNDCKAIFVAGGDGSVNSIVNELMARDLDIPLGILPAGTSNDFATYIGIPSNLSEAIDYLSSMRSQYVDIGRVNDRYFINVLSGGFFTNVAHNIDNEFKNALGRLAYYIEGVRQVPKFRPLHFKITTEEGVYDEVLYLFLLMNTRVTGGFERLAVNARINDGKMDFIGIRETPGYYMIPLFSKILRGEHLDDPYILFLQTDKMKIECLSDLGEFYETDIDGEKGPDIPIDVEVISKRIRIIY